MWRSETPDASPAHPFRAEAGVALVAALVVIAVVAAIGLGLALTTSLEPLAAANCENSWAVRAAAEAGIAAAAHELADVADWNLVLAGAIASALPGQSEISVDLPDGSRTGLAGLTNLATCGHTNSCTDTEASAFTADRPWGPNNPRWRLFWHGRLDQLAQSGEGWTPIQVVVWVGDDPAETDGDPSLDGGPAPFDSRRPGACVLALRAEAFGPRFGHKTVVATITRPDPVCGPGARLASWRALS
jgi:hypothetical protein